MSEVTLNFTAEQIDLRLENAGNAILHTEQDLTPEQQANARKNIGVDSSLLTTIDLTAYGTNVTIGDTVQNMIMGAIMGAPTPVTVERVGSFWEDVAAPGPIAVTFPFDAYTVRTTSATTMKNNNIGMIHQLCFGAICYHGELGILDVAVVIDISGGQGNAKVMVSVKGAAS